MSGDNRLKVGIAGAGILGRLIALRGEQLGWRVTLFDSGDEAGSSACSFRPPAMLAPICEREISEPVIAQLGTESLRLWTDIAQTLGDAVFFQKAGSLVVAHPQDRGELARFRGGLSRKAGEDSFRCVSAAELKELEPQLDSCFREGLYVPEEGQIDSRGALAALLGLLKSKGIECRFGCSKVRLAAKKIVANDDAYDFDLVIDARGYGAKEDLPELRAVRGEIVRLHAPQVQLNRPVRLLHPRHPIYVVPHRDGEYVVGATSIESEDDSPVSLRSALELLSAAFALNPAFGEARVVEMMSGLRPAFPDNLPRIIAAPGLIRVNGLYRHGFLISPKLAELTCAYIATESVEPAYASLVRRA